MKSTQAKGFSLVVSLPILLAVAALAAGGYLYLKSTGDKPEAQTATQEQAADTKQAEEVVPADETADWLAFTPDSKLYTLRLPDGWTFDHQDDECDCIMSQSTEFKPGTPASIRKVQGGRDGLRGLFVVADDTDKTTERFDGQTSAGKIEAKGMRGSKYIFKTPAGAEGIGPAPGSTEYNYYFVKNGRGIFVAYVVEPGENDQVELVEKSIRTLQ